LEKDKITPVAWDTFTGAKRAVWSDILHIYPGQTTNLNLTFEQGNFFNGIEEIWLFGDMTNWILNNKDKMDEKIMLKQTAGTFFWKGDAEANSHLRFGLTDTHDWTPSDDANLKKGAWFVPAANGNSAVTGSAGNTMSFIPLHTGGEDVEKAWKLDTAGYYEITVDPVNYKFYVEKPVIVETVTVSGPNSVKKGTATIAGDFTAVVTGKNIPAQEVEWFIVETNTATGTGINTTTGILTIAPDEPNDQLTVKAISTADNVTSGIKTIDITSAEILAKPGTPALNAEGVASWTYAGDANVTNYSLRLYKGDVEQGTAVPIAKGTFTHSFLTVMRNAGTGVYSFTVTAIGDGIDYATSPESDKSNTREVTQSPKITDIWWAENGKIEWLNPGGGRDGNYTVQVYENQTFDGIYRPAEYKDTPADVFPDTKSDYHLAFAGIPAKIGTLFSVTVITKGDDLLMIDSEESEPSNEIDYTVFGNSRVWVIIEGGGNYVAGADDGKLAYSTNGTTWNLSSGPAQPVFTGSDAVRAIAHNGATPGVFVAVGYNGKIARSADGGETWTAVDWQGGSGSIGGAYLTVAFGNNRFVVGGDNGELRASTDNTGSTWSTVTGWNNSAILDGDTLKALMFDGTRFVAVSTIGRNAWSTNGNDDWIYISNNLQQGGQHDQGTRNILNGAAGNNTFVIAHTPVGTDGSTHIPRGTFAQIESRDWLWSPHALFADDSDPPDSWSLMEAVFFGGGRFIGVGGHGRASVSNDSGATWTLVPASATGFTRNNLISAAAGLSGNRILLSGNEYTGGWGKMTIITVP